MTNARRAFSTMRTEGLASVGWRTGKWIVGRYNPFARKAISTVYHDDVVAVDWTRHPDFNAASMPPRDGAHRVAWIITPPGRTSGGHQNAFRFMSFLEQAGHTLTVYLYAPSRYPKLVVDDILQMMRDTSAYPTLRAEFRVYDPSVGMVGDFDAVFASDWENAYAAYRYQGSAKRFYFTQDFEPAFFAAGSDYVLAENTYRFGFHGFSAGRWLAGKLHDEYGMACDYYDYAVDTELYHHVNDARREEVLFYVRPPTPRRATEFGLLVLAEFHRLRPEVTINLVGWDMSGFDVPFPYVNHCAVDIRELNDIYNRCAAGLVLSLTNMSLLPMEIMSSGVVPVVNDDDNTKGFFDSRYIQYVPMAPRAMADKLIEILDNPDAVEHARTIAQSVADTDWGDPGSSFVAQFEAAMLAGE